jgi:hypothetical protein
MAKEYVPIFFDWLEVTQDLTAEEKGNLIDAVVAYAAGGEYEHLLSGGCKIAFRFLKGQVDRNNAISDKRSAAGSNKREQNETNGNKPEQTESNSPKEKEKDKENNNENKNKKKRDVCVPIRRFTPPTVEEVKQYCEERGSWLIDPLQFVNYYETRGWMLKKNQPMVDWKAAVRLWESNERKRQAENKNDAYDLPM